ncbi:MAG: phasin family protein [Motiliproteus sp.]
MKQKQQSTDWSAPLQPLVDMAMINFSAAQKCAEIQSNFISYLLDANLKQFQALADAKDPKSALTSQLAFIKAIDTRWCDTAEQEIETARDVQHSIAGILEKSIQDAELPEAFNNPLQKH